jgi:hypothetical protein
MKKTRMISPSSKSPLF